jgi:hypothetical protein
MSTQPTFPHPKSLDDALAPPIPPRVAALVEQLERQKQDRPAAMDGPKEVSGVLFEEQEGAPCIYRGGIGSTMIR